MKTYLALGDSMSIDRYTGVKGGGAASQLFKRLGPGWRFDDRTEDGCVMEGVRIDLNGDLITLTIGGNNLLLERAALVRNGLGSFRKRHRLLLAAIRARNPDARFIVGNVYEPQVRLPEHLRRKLREANDIIDENAAHVDAELVDIHGVFLGREEELLTQIIEPNFAGATEIANLFETAAGYPAMSKELT